jgi:hypothetical protein
MEEYTDADDAELISFLISLEREVGELKSNSLTEYMMPHHLVRILKLIPWRFDQPQS